MRNYGILKGQLFNQTGPAINLNSATLQLPSAGPIYSLHASNGFELNVLFADQATLDKQFPAGSYILIQDLAHDGVITVTNRLAADNYPATAPQLVNFDGLKTINCGADFKLAWLPLNGNTNQFLWVVIDEASSGETVFSSPWWGNAGALNGASTSVFIPAGTLRAGFSYQATVLYAALTVDTASYPGALGLTGCNKQTQFTLTVPGTPYPKKIQVQGRPKGSFQMRVTGEPGRTNILESTASLANPSWFPLVTNVGSFNYSDTLLLPSLFYRLREASATGP